MANEIKMAVRNAILTLYKRNWSQRKISRELGIDRETVKRYIQQAKEPAAKPSIPPPGKIPKPAISTAGDEGAKPAIPPPGILPPESGRQSQCMPFRQQIFQWLDQGLSAQRIYQDLVSEWGYEGSYDSVKRFVRKLKAAHPKRIWRMESLPGEEAQVDFGTGAPIFGADGKRRKSHIFRITLSYSRKSYSEAVFYQTTEMFIRCLENALRHFGGVPQTLCIDNLRAAVQRADWYEPELNPKIESFCRHYGTVILPTRPRKPEHKGKVESAVKYVKNNALKGRVFHSLQEENLFLQEWEKTVADGRIHGTTRQQVRKRFLEVERPALQSLPMSLFPCFQEGQRTVHRDAYVEVAQAYYEAPDEYIGKAVWVRWDSRTVRIFNHRFEQIKVHARKPPGQYSSCLFTRGRRSASIERDTAYWLRRCSWVGEDCGQWAVEVVAQRGAPGIRVLQGLIQLARKHSAQALNEACGRALSHGAYRLRDLKRLIHKPHPQETFRFMDRHPLIREMSEYGAFLDTLYSANKTPKKEVI